MKLEQYSDWKMGYFQFGNFKSKSCQANTSKMKKMSNFYLLKINFRAFSHLHLMCFWSFPSRHHPVEGEKFRLSNVRHPPVISNSIQFLLHKILSTPSPFFPLPEYIPLLLLLIEENGKTAPWHRLDDMFWIDIYLKWWNGEHTCIYH